MLSPSPQESFFLDQPETLASVEEKEQVATPPRMEELSPQELVQALDQNFQPEQESSAEDLLARLPEDPVLSNNSGSVVQISSSASFVAGRPPQVQRGLATSADHILQIAQGDDRNPVASWAQHLISRLLTD